MKAIDKVMITLGGIVVFSFLANLAILAFTGRYPEAYAMSNGGLLTAFGTVVGYYFGSSKGSADKSEMLNNRTP
jgi:hypothetical protein